MYKFKYENENKYLMEFKEVNFLGDTTTALVLTTREENAKLFPVWEVNEILKEYSDLKAIRHIENNNVG